MEQSQNKDQNQAKDPVCDMMVDTRTATITSEYRGTTYYFCAPGCKKAFDREPEKYLGSSEEAATTG